MSYLLVHKYCHKIVVDVKQIFHWELNMHRMRMIRRLKNLTLDQIFVLSGRRISIEKLSRFERNILIPKEEEKEIIAKILKEPKEKIFPDKEELDSDSIDYMKMFENNRDLYRKIKKKMTKEEKLALLDCNGDYLIYREKLNSLQKKYLQNSG